MTDYVVIIPTRNRYTDCLRAIRSAFAQTLPPAEVVVVDDASTDARYEWLDEIVGNPRLTVIRRKTSSQEETGAGFAVGTVRNTALAHVLRTDFDGWLAFLDDDDEWSPGKMLGQIEAAGYYKDVAVFSTNAFNRTPAGLICGHHHPPHGRRLAHGCFDVTSLLKEMNPVINSTAIIRAAAARKLGTQRPSGFGEDHDYWRRAAILSPVFRLDEPLVFYTVGNQKEYSL